MKFKLLFPGLIVTALTTLCSFNGLADSEQSYMSGNIHKPHAQLSQAFNGFFIGAEGGYAHTRENITIRIPSASPDKQTQRFHGSGDNFAGDFYVGYGYQTGVFHIAARATVDTNKLRSNNLVAASNGDHDRQVNLYRVFGIDLQPGFLVSPRVLIFGDLGVGYYNFDYRVNVGGNPHHFSSSNVFRVNVGGGIAYALTDHISVHALVQYTPNSTEHFEYGNNFSSEQTNIMRYMLGVSYSFT